MREADAVSAVRAGAQANGVEVLERADGKLEIPGETITDPAVYTLALAHSAHTTVSSSASSPSDNEHPA